MTVIQTMLVFGAIPAGIIAIIFIAVYGKSMIRQPNRYRPGKSWDYPPSWYVPHPDAVLSTSPGKATGQTSTTATGGASGEW